MGYPACFAEKACLLQLHEVGQNMADSEDDKRPVLPRAARPL